MWDKSDVHRAVHHNIISIIKPIRCTNISNFLKRVERPLHVLDSLSVRQQFKTVHTEIPRSKQTAVSV